MSTARMLRRFGAFAVVTGMLAGVSHAQTLDKRVLFTFNAPVSVPGVTLAPGQYLFRLADPGPTGSRRIVQVASADGRQSYAMLFTHAAERTEVTSSPELRFMETGAGMPAAVRTWWFGGERTGYEFIYPKEQARKLAESANAPVLTTVEETAKPATESHLEYVEPGGRETEIAAAQPFAAVGPVEVGTMVEARSGLPKTASSLPLIGLIGLLALGAAGGVRAWGIVRR